MVMLFEFDQQKAIETILYLAGKISDPDKYGICKLLYLADKCSLEQYGRFIFGESYVAMKEGSTPSNAYDLLKEASIKPIEGIKVEGNKVFALREANFNRLSESDIECLDQIISSYGDKPIQRRDAAHDKAWKQSWEKRGSKKSVQIPVENIAELVDDTGNLIDYVINRNTE
jgi:uncharacterized phage-associated protein